MIDQEHGWESREIAGKTATVATCEMCGRPIDGVAPVDDDKAVFGDPETTILMCVDCREIQARNEEPLPVPDDDIEP